MEQSSALLPTIGQTLIRAREQKQWTEEQVARTLNMPVNTIRALEQNDFAAIPQLAFLKGYLRSYARLLELDADQLMQRFNEEYAPETIVNKSRLINPSVKPIRITVKSDRPAGRGKWLTLGGLILLGVAGLLAWWWKSQAAVPKVLPAEVSEATTVPLIERVRQLVPQSVTRLVENDRSAVPSAVPASPEEEKSAAAKQAVAAEAALPVNQQPATIQKVDLYTPENGGYAEPSLDRLQLAFNGPAQVTIRDAEGQTLYTGRKQPDQPLNLQGIAPFSIKIKGTPNVNLQLNGQPVDLNLYSVNGRADFRLSH